MSADTNNREQLEAQTNEEIVSVSETDTKVSESDTDTTSSELTLSDVDEDLDSEDSLTFSNGVIEKIVAISVRDVSGVLGMKGGFFNRVQETFGATDPTKGVSVEVMPDNSVRVNISVIIEYGVYAPQVFEDVKKVVVDQVVGMTGLEVGGVALRIEDVLTREEYEHMKRARFDGAASEDEER